VLVLMILLVQHHGVFDYWLVMTLAMAQEMLIA
jgi:hypothetical protein